MDAKEANELTLQGLAQRLETLERENAELRHKVATLEDSGTRRDELAEKRGSDTPRDAEPVTAEEFAGRVSRRSLLSKAGAAALGAVAAGTLLNQREAQAVTGTFDHVEVNSQGRDAVHAHSAQADAVYAVAGNVGAAGGRGRGVFGYSYNGQWPGVEGGNHEGGLGVRGRSNGIGVSGEGGQTGVLGFGKTYAGVVGRGAQFGGVFNAEKSGAQLFLIPGESRDRPTIGDHARGELYMDATGTLFVCTDGGNPGVWRVFQTGPA